MDLQTLILNAVKENTSGRHQFATAIKFTFECVDDEYCVLHRVAYIPNPSAGFELQCPLDDREVREHFERLLSSNYHDYVVVTAEVTA